MVIYNSAIDLSTALVTEFGDMSIVHEQESDGLHILSASIVSLLERISVAGEQEADILQLIQETIFCFSAQGHAAMDSSKEYLMLLISQGIIRRTQ